MIIRSFQRTDESAVIALWNACGLTRPWNDPAKDIAFAVAGPASTILVASVADEIIGSVMLGHDGHRGAIYYFAVAPNHQRQGLGRKLHEAAMAWLRERGVWKINLQVRAENQWVAAFYKSLGYEDQQTQCLGKWLNR